MEVIDNQRRADLRRGLIRRIASSLGSRLIAWGGADVASDKPLRKSAVSSSSRTHGTSAKKLHTNLLKAKLGASFDPDVFYPLST
jgi:hypothetical protein